MLRGALLELLPKWRLDELELLGLGRVTVVRVLLWLKLRGVALGVEVLGDVVEGRVVVVLERPPNERLPCWFELFICGLELFLLLRLPPLLPLPKVRLLPDERRLSMLP